MMEYKYIHDKRGYENIIVSFGSLVGLFGGINSGEFRKTLNKFNTDTLFIFDDEQLWYLKGIGELSEFILEITKPYKNVGFLGSSMGGFGAMLLSMYCKPNSVITLSPQTVIGDYKRNVFGDLRFSKFEVNIMTFDGEHFDLSKFDYYSDIHIFYGDKEPYDSKHAEHMKDKCILHPIDTDEHNVAGVLKRSGRLESSILKSFPFISFI